VHRSIVEQCQWSFSSTRKTLDRMVEKGLVCVSSDSGVREFSPGWSKTRTLAVLISDFTGRVLEFRNAPRATMFVDSGLLNEAELEELEMLLEKGDI
jgi:predicted transcriptional regulator